MHLRDRKILIPVHEINFSVLLCQGSKKLTLNHLPEIKSSSGAHIKLIVAIVVTLVLTAVCAGVVCIYKKRRAFRTPPPSEASDSVLEMKMWKNLEIADATVIQNPGHCEFMF